MNNGSELQDLTLREQLRQLPSVDRLLNSTGGKTLVENYGRRLTLQVIREILEQQRADLRTGSGEALTLADLVDIVEARLRRLVSPTLVPVINATGVIIHTNLGRAPLGSEAVAAVEAIAGGYSNLEYNLVAGTRGSRSVHAEQLLVKLTGAEAALVVNNNAAAVLLMLTALCSGNEVLISRGQLVEIGGGFRVPDVMAQSGAYLREVGTTNRTHLHDYAANIGENCGAILVAHHSNYKIVGFTSEPKLSELAELAHDRGLVLLYDQGSGAFLDTSVYGLDAEPTVQAALDSGVDIVSFSGDKLVGGPQAGILCGRADLISRLKKHPLARAVRADKLCLAALTTTLNSFVTDRAVEDLPIWRMISRPLEEIAGVAHRWQERLQQSGLAAELVDGQSTVGGGSLPGATLSTRLVAVRFPDVEKVAIDLRANYPPVIARIGDASLLLDPRTVAPDQEDELLDAVIGCSRTSGIG